MYLEILTIKKDEDSDFIEYYEFFKETIFKFLGNYKELKEKYNFIVDMFDVPVNIDNSDIVSSEELH